MSLSKEWTEWHLTPRGWEGGSGCVDFGRTTFKEEPSDRVATYRWLEEQPSFPAPMYRGLELVWHSPDKEAIERLKKQFGEAPNHL